MTTPLLWYLAAFALAISPLLIWARANAATAQRSDLALARRAAFLVACLNLALALFSPLSSLADVSFAAHMVEHELFLFVIPIALLIARPAGPLVRRLRWLPGSFRRGAARLFYRPAKQTAAFLGHPAGAFVLFTLVLWIWHAPQLYGLALDNEAIHAVEHLSMLGSALLYWRPLFAPGGGRHDLDTGAKCALYLTSGAFQGGFLGAILALSNHVFYSGYLTQPHAPGAILADQRLGGAIMWFSAPIFYTAAMSLSVTWTALRRSGG